MKKLRVLIVEAQSHVCPTCLAQGLSYNHLLEVHTTQELPNSLSKFDVIVLNSLPFNYSLPQEKIVRFTKVGGGLLCIHDTVFPPYGYLELLNIVGIRYAFDVINIEEKEGKPMFSYNVVRGDPGNPAMFFPVKVVPENATHPILENVDDFEIEEEFWAINTAPGVKELLTIEVGDRIPCHFRYRKPVTICGSRSVEKERTCFLLLGHVNSTYINSDVLRLVNNIILWLGKKTSDNRYQFDIFLSFSSHDKSEADKILRKAKRKKIRVFVSEKDLVSGDIWDEKIREALLGSREMAILLSPDSLKSEWVTTEWGAAWALQKRITPIRFRCNLSQLPDRLKRYQAKDMHDIDIFIDEVISRAIG